MSRLFHVFRQSVFGVHLLLPFTSSSHVSCKCMWTFCVQNRKQKHPKDSADAVNSTKSSEPGSKKAYRKTGSSQGFRSAWLRHGQPNSEVPCSYRSDPVMLQKLSLRKTNSYWVQLVPTVTQKGCCTSKSAPSWYAEKVDVSVKVLYSQLGAAFVLTCAWSLRFQFRCSQSY